MFAASKTAGAVSAAPPASSDPQFNYVSLLLNDTGTNGQQNNTFLDSSSNNFTITRNGTPTQGSVTPYWPEGQWSNYFGGSGNYLTTPSISLGTSSFTLEAWVYRTAAKATEILASGTTSGGFNIGFESSGTVIEISRYNVAYIAQVSATVPLNQWFHVAVTRDINSYRVFLNGVQVGATVTDSNSISASAYRITDSATSGNNVTGYVSNLRLVTGTALYTSNFTPPTTPLTAVSGTSLLTCQSNRFKDNSSNNFAITVTGTPTVQAFEPFEPASSYAKSVGGSGYFNSANIRAAYNTALDISTGDFTIEFMVNAPAQTGGGNTVRGVAYFNGNLVTGNDIGWDITFNTNGSLTFEFVVGNNGAGTINVATGTSACNNSWNHIAVSRNGSTFRIFLNGVLQNTATSSSSCNTNAGWGVYAGSVSALNTANIVSTYISNLRIIKGTAVYTANFTPPTSPVTAITGTSLLLNFTNAGIYDAATLNDLVTVGNAQVSTAQAKFGSSSMLFNGTSDYLSASGNDLHNLPGDFTIEGWFYTNSTAQQCIVGKWNNTGNVAWVLNVIPSSSTIQFATGNNGSFVATFNVTATINTGTWYHIAVTRSGTSVRMFLNGTQAGTTQTSSSNLTAANTNALLVGQFQASSYFSGYLDDLRITKGYARYTANFTPPTAPFPTR